MRIDHDMNSTYDSDRASGQFAPATIRSLRLDRPRREKLGEAAFHQANAFELGRPAEQILKVYEDIVGRKKDATAHA